MIRNLLFLFFVAFALLLFPHTAYASENFTSAYTITYTVAPTGKTHVELLVRLTNKASYVYSATHTINLGLSDIENAVAKDTQGQITPTVEKKDRGYAITTPFHKAAVGKGKTQTYLLTLDTKSIAQAHGDVFEVVIPGIAKNNTFSAYTVVVHIPKQLGTPSWVKPQTEINEKKTGYVTYTYTKQQLEQSGIALGFGKQQYYHFRLLYHLQNSNLFPKTVTIALPPTTNYQDVFIDSISENPENVEKDSDGNWIASYFLHPTQRKKIIVEGTIVLFLTPKKEPLSEALREQYLTATNIWQATHPTIQELAKRLKTPEKIYAYVVNTLSYNYTRAANNTLRLGALDALQKPTDAICLEFTDLFIAIARAAGIPAREVDGYAQGAVTRPVTVAKDILHAWPEYYDEKKQQWIMVDPTWQQTTNGVDYFHSLDLNHITFVKKGVSSVYPIPAGAYKSNTNEKDVSIKITKAPTKKEAFAVQPVASQYYFSLLPIWFGVQVHNTGNTEARPHDVTISSNTFGLPPQKLRFSQLLPFGQQTQYITIWPSKILTKREETITIAYDGKIRSKTIIVSPVLFQRYFSGGEILIGICAIIISAIAFLTWRLSILGRKR